MKSFNIAGPRIRKLLTILTFQVLTIFFVIMIFDSKTFETHDDGTKGSWWSYAQVYTIRLFYLHEVESYQPLSSRIQNLQQHVPHH